MTFSGTPRPRLRWHHAETELDDFAIVSYRVPAGALARMLPAGFAPMEFAFADGETSAMVSAVAFRDRDFHFRFCPPAAISCGQINYRAYVTADGEPGVWFFGTSLDHPVVAVPRLLWGMPWSRARIGITADWDAAPARWRLDGDGARCEAAELAAPPETLDGFTGESHWMAMLTHPTLGWYRRRDGRVGTYSIWHPPMRPRHLAASSARFHVFEELGLTAPESEPHSILAQESIHFDVHTPPRRSREGSARSAGRSDRANA
ncbi:DUF2071 domain-containing protein [Planomonospora sp. ID67723]|uniref:DUF2071 domain-containing protein n=1 Tax=Planomonospora sp. ID67723 TaxID=2738134 RepID=UPI0018C3B654|nr:DUF2071 domain-containing protein [Planomonospora sp. ID67723]MBG0830904.1 DUF2071 domain-containing protein [Planomonospora sp. ID67723]